MSRPDGRAIRRGLADVVLGDEARAAAAARMLGRAGAWDVAVALAEAWRLTLALHERLLHLAPRLAEGCPDAGTLARLRRHSVAASARTVMAVARSREVLALFADVGVEAVAIKGVALIAGLYGRRAVRLVGDLDVLVRPDQTGGARAALEGAGFVERGDDLAQHLAEIAASPRLHNFARMFVRDGFEVDLHWQFGPNPPPGLQSERIMARAERSVLAGTPVKIAAPADAMVIGAHHALRGYLVPHETIKDAFDLAAWWEVPARWSFSDLLRTAQDAEAASAVLALLAIVARRNAGHPVSAGAEALATHIGAHRRREAFALADFFEDQLAVGERAERTVQLFAPLRLGRALLAKSPEVVRPPQGGRNETEPRDPLGVRLGRAGRRVARVLRELARPRAFRAYRALARAQGRLR